MILVTGASGYLGSHITKRLVASGKSVRAMVHNPERAKKEGRLHNLNIEWVKGDVNDEQSLKVAFNDIEAVVHTVAVAIEKGNKTYEKINIQGTVNLVNAAKENGVKRFINISQLGAASDLPYRFLASKGKAQDYVAQSGLDWTAFRPSVVWGPEDEFANTFARLVPLSPIIYPIIGDENARFQPVWVDDVASCVLAALDDPSTIGHEYELGGPEVLTLAEIEHRTLQAIGAKRVMVRFPMPLLKLIVALMESFLPAPPVTRSLLELLAIENVTRNNSLEKFVQTPKPFTAENAAIYMRAFRIGETLAQYFGR